MAGAAVMAAPPAEQRNMMAARLWLTLSDGGQVALFMYGHGSTWSSDGDAAMGAAQGLAWGFDRDASAVGNY